MNYILCIVVTLVSYCSAQGRTYGRDKLVPVPIPDPMPLPIHRGSGVDNIGVDRWQGGGNWQNTGNWGNSGLINQRRTGGFVDDLQNFDLLRQGRRRGSRLNRGLNRGLIGSRGHSFDRQLGNSW